MLDIYSTYAQLAAIEQMPRPQTLLWDLFVNDEGVVEDDKAIYDYRKGVMQMAPIVHENTGGVVMGRTGYGVFSASQHPHRDRLTIRTVCRSCFVNPAALVLVPQLMRYRSALSGIGHISSVLASFGAAVYQTPTSQQPL